MGMKKSIATAKTSTVAVITRTLNLQSNQYHEVISGSGVVVGAGLVATCFHVLACDPTVAAQTSYGVILDSSFDGTKAGQPWLHAGVALVDESSDLAILRVSNLDAPPAKFRTPCNCVAGEDVFWVGHPQREVAPVVGAGIIASVQLLPPYPGGPTKPVMGFRLDATSFPFNSGGGLFDESALLIGINNAAPYLINPDLINSLKAVQNGGGGLVGGVDVVGVLRAILEDMTGKTLGGTAYAIRGDVVRELVGRVPSTESA